MKPKLKLGTLTHFNAKQADILMMNKNPEKKKNKPNCISNSSIAPLYI